mgnify:CR=1 FL=1
MNNHNNGTPKYVIKSALSPYRKSPASGRRYTKKVTIPESSIYANRKTTDLKLTFSRCVHSVSEKPTVTALEAEARVHDIKECAVNLIQQFMKSYFTNHPNINKNNCDLLNDNIEVSLY